VLPVNRVACVRRRAPGTSFVRGVDIVGTPLASLNRITAHGKYDAGIQWQSAEPNPAAVPSRPPHRAMAFQRNGKCKNVRPRGREPIPYCHLQDFEKIPSAKVPRQRTLQRPGAVMRLRTHALGLRHLRGHVCKLISTFASQFPRPPFGRKKKRARDGSCIGNPVLRRPCRRRCTSRRRNSRWTMWAAPFFTIEYRVFDGGTI